MITPTLNDAACQHLETIFKTTADRRLRERCQAILMADRQRRHGQMAQDIGVSTRTMQRWLNSSHTGGLDGLTIHWAPGHSPHIAEVLAPEMLVWVKQGPAGCGLDRTSWTYAELALSLYQASR